MSDKKLSLKEFVEELNSYKDNFSDDWKSYSCSKPGDASIDAIIIDDNGNESYGTVLAIYEDFKIGCGCVCGLTIRIKKHE